MHFFNDDANISINTVLEAARHQWVSYHNEFDMEFWYRTKKFGNQWGVIILTHDEGTGINDVDICIATMEQICSHAENSLENLDEICQMEEVQGKAGLKFLIWVKNVILSMQGGKHPNWEDEVTGLRLVPSDERRMSAYRRMTRYGFRIETGAFADYFIWTK